MLSFLTAEEEGEGHEERCARTQECAGGTRGVPRVASRLWMANDLDREVFVVLTSIEDRLGMYVDFVFSPVCGSPARIEEDVERDARGDLGDLLRLGAVLFSADMRLLRWAER